MSCDRAQGFLASRKIGVKERVDATKARLGADDALKLAHASWVLITIKGKGITRLEMRSTPPTDEAVLAAMLGPTGNLRAPTIRFGSTVIVGFAEEVYEKFLTS